MKSKVTPAERLAHEGVRRRMPDGRTALIWSGYHPERGRIVIVKPIKESRNAAPRQR